MPDLNELLAITEAQHKHHCPRQVLGVRMGMYAAELLGIALPQADRRVLVFVETDGYFADGVSAATGCTLGHRTLRHIDHGKTAGVFIDARADFAIRNHPASDARKRAAHCQPEAQSRWHAQLQAYQLLSNSELFVAREVIMTVSIRELISRPGVHEVVMTTNCTRLAELAQPLADAGLHRVNISLDSLDAQTFQRMTRRGNFDQVWTGVIAAEEAGLTPIKLNAVIVRGYNDSAVTKLAKLTLDHPRQVRFIELMPLGEMAGFSTGYFFGESEMRARIAEEYKPLEALNNGVLDGETCMYRFPQAAGTVGFISSISHPFCAQCNRARLTADGVLRLCLLRDGEVDLLTPLRAGADNDTLRELIERNLYRKPWEHQLSDDVVPVGRVMSQIGGNMAAPAKIAILAGGKSRRMGTDKSFVLLDKKPLLQHVIDRVSVLGLPLILIANQPEKYRQFGLPIFTDIIPDSGSLGGLYTAIQSTGADRTLCVACDMPFLNPTLLRLLLDQCVSYDAVVPKTENTPHGLHAVYTPACSAAMHANILRGDLAIHHVFSLFHTKFVTEDTLRSIDPLLQSLVNMNTPADLASRADHITSQ